MNILLNNNNNTLYHNYDIIPKTSFVNFNNRLIISTPFLTKSTISYGLIVYAKNTKRWVLIQRKHSVEFLLIIKGLYRISYLPILLLCLTLKELNILKKCIDDKEYFKDIYELLQLDTIGYEYACIRIKENKLLFKRLLNNININDNILSWNWPKGRLHYKKTTDFENAETIMETPFDCAKREFAEEVEITLPPPIYISENYINNNIKTINGRIIESRYWIYIIENEVDIKPPINNPEVISRDWFDTDKTKLLLNNDEFFNDIKKHINTYFENI
jgi:8-oxo-dGTP pyrophosphatase MutT (NUDIX family)